MNRNEKKKKKKKTFVMFLYACGVSRVHQEFWIVWTDFKRKNCADFKKREASSHFAGAARLKVADTKVSFLSRSFFSLLFPPPPFPLLFSPLSRRHAQSACRLVSGGWIQKKGGRTQKACKISNNKKNIYKQNKAMDLGMPVFSR